MKNTMQRMYPEKAYEFAARFRIQDSDGGREEYPLANFTKKAIRDSFVKLLNEKPLNQITVRDIVEDCGVNRNTFYYYFQDIPQLLEAVVNEDADRIIQEYPAMDSIEDCLNAVIRFALENRKAVVHIARSTNRDIYERHLWRTCNHVITVYMDEILSGRSVSAEDRKLMIDYAMCLVFGFVLGWVDGGMEDDICERFHRLCQLKQGEIERMIEKCEKKL